MKALWVALFALVTALSASADDYELGVHYDELPISVDTADPSRIEVVEVFSYGCIHCYSSDRVDGDQRHGREHGFNSGHLHRG